MKVSDLGFRVQGLGFRVQGIGLRVSDFGSRVQGQELGTARDTSSRGSGSEAGLSKKGTRSLRFNV